MADFLGSQAEKERERRQEAERSIRKKEKKKQSSKEKTQKKSDFVTVSSSGGSDSSDSSLFRMAPARGGKELWRVAQKRPGHLTSKALDEMSRYLADRSEMDSSEQKWRGQKVQAYVNQVMFTAMPPARLGLRTAREVQTLAVSIDHLLSGRLPQATDTLVQRLKALESASQDGDWRLARRLETWR